MTSRALTNAWLNLLGAVQARCGHTPPAAAPSKGRHAMSGGEPTFDKGRDAWRQ